MTDLKQTAPKYPNAFLFGSTAGVVIQLMSHQAMGEPLAARPFSYVRLGLFFGVAISYWDYFRRQMLEDALKGEQRARYHFQLRAINQTVRHGEEDEIQNLTDYLATTTTRV